MLNFRPGVGPIVAADAQNAMKALDDALLNGLRMFTTVVEGTVGSNLPAAQSQRLFTSMNAGLSQVLAGRDDFVATVRQLAQIKGESNFAPEDYGCPAGWVPAMERAQPQPQLAQTSVD